jgi:hypothetical protein
MMDQPSAGGPDAVEGGPVASERAQAPRALSQPQLRAMQRESDRLPSSRDRVIVQLLMLMWFYARQGARADASDGIPERRRRRIATSPGGQGALAGR